MPADARVREIAAAALTDPQLVVDAVDVRSIDRVGHRLEHRVDESVEHGPSQSTERACGPSLAVPCVGTDLLARTASVCRSHRHARHRQGVRSSMTLPPRMLAMTAGPAAPPSTLSSSVLTSSSETRLT